MSSPNVFSGILNSMVGSFFTINVNSVLTASFVAVMVVVPWVKTVTVVFRISWLFDTVATDRSELSKIN